MTSDLCMNCVIVFIDASAIKPLFVLPGRFGNGITITLVFLKFRISL